MPAIVAIPLLIVRMVVSILWALFGSPVRGWRARRTFRAALRRTGLSPKEADALTEAYRPGLGLRDLARAARPHVG